ncbi:hypothetical protein PLICRDRAFT_78107, partial [Plicaturopsis crispa FD-325 SS-3]
WTMPEFLYRLFEHANQGADFARTRRHAACVERFLGGRTKYTPSDIVDLWMKHPDGALDKYHDEYSLMYSTTTSFLDIKSVRPALTAFAAQRVEKCLVKEAEMAVKASSGLHASGVLPLAWHYMMKIAQREPRKREGKVAAVRKSRPVEGVCTHALSELIFCRSDRARLLPISRGLLYFASSAPVDLFAYNSRIGAMPAYSTVYNTARDLADQEAAVTRTLGNNPAKWGILRLDNVQNYHRQRDLRIGRENKMVIGIAATWIEAEGIDMRATDLEDKRQRIAENKRKDVTVEQLMSFIDQEHIEVISILQWLHTLVHNIPELAHLKEHVSLLYRTRAAINRLPVQQTPVHPLATSGRNETVTTELKAALLDFFSQLGVTDANYLHRLLAVGGDGLTFEKLLQMKRYLQSHGDAFKSFELLEVVLELWHTRWTDLSRIFETHWGSNTSSNPATLSHSARKIGRAPPSSLKKVDFYPSSQLVYLVLDVRMLDCWRIHYGQTDLFAYFKTLKETGTLPPFEDLEVAARTLHRAYSSNRAYHRVISDASGQDKWSAKIPLGSPWKAPI